MRHHPPKVSLLEPAILALLISGILFYGPLAGYFLGDDILLESPQDYQVFQRDAHQIGLVKVQGTIHLRGETSGMLHLEMVSRGQKPVGEAVQIPLTFQNGQAAFHADLSIPSGGWYVLNVFWESNGRIRLQKTLAHIGVGEVFLAAGQSLTTNTGEARLKPNDDRVVAYDAGSRLWRVAADPQPFVDGNGGSVWPPLGDDLTAALHVPIGFIPMGVSGTSAKEWLPGTAGFDRLLLPFQQLGDNSIRAVLWQQGEADAMYGVYTTSAERPHIRRQYEDRLRLIIRTFQKRVHHPIPWIVAQASFQGPLTAFPGGPEEAQAIRAAQEALWKNHDALAGPDMDQLGLPLRRDGTHLNHKGQLAAAHLWFEALRHSGLLPDPTIQADRTSP